MPLHSNFLVYTKHVTFDQGLDFLFLIFSREIEDKSLETKKNIKNKQKLRKYINVKPLKHNFNMHLFLIQHVLMQKKVYSLIRFYTPVSYTVLTSSKAFFILLLDFSVCVKFPYYAYSTLVSELRCFCCVFAGFSWRFCLACCLCVFDCFCLIFIVFVNFCCLLLFFPSGFNFLLCFASCCYFLLFFT